MSSKLTREEKQLIVQLWEHGKSFNEIYAITGRSRAAVESLLKSVGVEPYYEYALKRKTENNARALYHENTDPIYNMRSKTYSYPLLSTLSDEEQKEYLELGRKQAESELDEIYNDLMHDAPEYTYNDPTLSEAIEMILDGKESTILADILYNAIREGRLVEV